MTAVPDPTPAALAALLGRQWLWRGADAVPTAPPDDGLATGLAALDAVLPRQGWPAAGLVEVLSTAHGVGELSLLLPALAALSRRDKPVLLVAPPFRPYAPAWQRAGVRLSRLQVLEAATTEALWAMEQALRAGCCSAVLGWPAEAEARALRRLQVAAETGQTLGFLFRAVAAARSPSPAPLRLQVEQAPCGSALRILKCRGRHPPAGVIPLSAARGHGERPAPGDRFGGPERPRAPSPGTAEGGPFDGRRRRAAPCSPSPISVAAATGGQRPAAVPALRDPPLDSSLRLFPGDPC